MAALIREPPRGDAPARRMSLRASADELDVSKIARASGDGGGHRQAAGFSSNDSIEEITEFIRREFAAASRWRVRGARPRAGSSSSTSRPAPRRSRSCAQLRERDGRAGRAMRGRSTRSRPGSCSSCSGLHEGGAALRRAAEALRDGRRPLADDVHRRSRGRGRRRARASVAARARGAARRSPRRDRPQHPRRLRGQDRRRAGVQAPPPRRGRRDADAQDDGLRARARGVRGAHCAPRPAPELRRLRARGRRGARRPLREPAPHDVGPFDVADADPARIVPPAEALAALEGMKRRALAPEGARLRSPRAVALGTFDGVHLGHRRVIETLLDAGPEPTVVTFDPHPRTALGNRVDLLMSLERRLELLAELGVEAALVVEFTLDVAAAGAAGLRGRVASADRRRDGRRGRGLPLRTRPAGRPHAPREPRLRHARRSPLLEGVSSSAHPRARARRRRRGAASSSGGPSRSKGSSSPATREAGRSASRRRTSTCARSSSSRRTGSTRAQWARPAQPSRSGRTRTTAAASAASRRTCSTSRATSTAGGCRRALGAAA